MPTRPLLAKLTRPRLHGAVPRDRLFDRLDDARDERPALCVVGPPGAGKTTLVASWLDSRRVPGIWYQIDPGDADLPTFFHYLGQACVPFARKGQAPLPALTPEYRDDTAGFSRRFFRELFSRLPDGACIVLDNYQEVGGGSTLHTLFAEAIEEIPVGVLAVVVSRRDPPDSYARLVANERVALLDWTDLRLTLDEARAIAATRTPIADEELARLHDRSDGWAAGLTLMLEGRRREPSLSAPVPASRDALFSYFAAQIFDHVSPDVRRFLVATALLPQVPVSVARELTGQARAADVLEDLHRRHLFTHRRAGTEPVYWYHALFRDFLQSRAVDVLGATEIPSLQSRAARLLEATGEFDGAFELFRDAGDWQSAARLAERQAESLISQGRGQLLQAWLADLPGEVLGQAPWLRYWLGIALIPFAPASARRELEAAHDLFVTLEDHRGIASTAAGLIDCCIFEWSDFHPLRRWVECLAAELPRLHLADSPKFERRVNCSLLLGMLYSTHGHAGLLDCVERVTRLLDEAVSADDKLVAAMMLLAYCNLTSDSVLGAAVAARGSDFAARPEVTPFARMWWHIRHGLFLALDGSHAAAVDALDLAEAIASSHGFDRVATTTCLIATYRARATAAVRDHRATRKNCMRAIAAATSDSPMARYHDIQARIYLAWASGDERAAAAFGERAMELAKGTGMPYVLIITRAYHAVALAATHQFESLRELLALQRREIRHSAFSHFAIEADLLEAWMLITTGRRDDGLVLLSSALSESRATSRRYMSILSSTRIMAEILDHAAEAGLCPDHVADLVSRLKIPPPPLPSEHWPWPAKIRTLGRFEIAIDNTPLRFEGKVPRKPLALLKAVIALGGTAVPVARILDALWPDEAGDTAYKSLGVALTRLRKILLVPDIVTVSDEAISINRQLCWVDAFQFLDDTAPSVTTDASRHRERAALLYQGAFLPADPEAPWSARMRERLRSRYLATVEALATQAEEDGRWDDALDWYRRGTESDELAEALYRGQMRVLRATGRAAEAMSTYRRFRQLLSVVLGIAPSEQTQSLARAIQEETASVGNP